MTLLYKVDMALHCHVILASVCLWSFMLFGAFCEGRPACQGPDIKYDMLLGLTGSFGGKDDNRMFLVLDKVCLDQETFIIYDPEVRL